MQRHKCAHLRRLFLSVEMRSAKSPPDAGEEFLSDVRQLLRHCSQRQKGEAAVSEYMETFWFI